VFQPELTAVMPVTRMAGRLAHLKPLLNKCTSLGLEVVIVHDEQDSKTGYELEEIRSSVNSRSVTLVTKSLFSPGKARNLGLEIASGDWICFWDSDDIPIPESFLEMVHRAGQSDYEVAAGNFLRTAGNVKARYGSAKTEIGRMPGIWRVAFKRDFINGGAFPEYRMGEDQVFLAMILVRLQDYFEFEEIVYEYNCENPGQLTKNQNAILELEFAIRDMLKVISSPKVNNVVALVFLSRQILTLFKHGTPKLKLTLIGVVAKGVKLGGSEFLITFIKEIFASLEHKLISRRKH
jgi:glycosyltransferase involved in cell wall biosynthesis